MPTGVYTRTKPAYSKGKHTGHVAWNKGLRKGMDPRMANVGTYPRTEHHRQVAINNLRVLFGKPAWNKGLTKENHPGIARGAEAVRLLNLGKHHSEETKAKMSLSHKGRKYNESGKRKKSQDMFWATISPELKSEFIRRSRLRTSKKKTNPEIQLEEILNLHFPGEWKYVGDGKLIIAGLIPDFANVNGRKQLIELFGDYWHKGENPENRIAKFEEFGYDCLILWEHELAKPDEITTKIQKSFIGGKHG